MKKVITLVFYSLLIISTFTSCKKEYTCECITTVGGLEVGTSSSTIKDTEKKAKDQCESNSSSVSVNGITSTTSCSLK